jgi:phage shock protein PspC (stress-responsive transcriptional regulator)
MNKTVTINISGIIFHIEEDAFEKLSKYLSTIKGYFSKNESGNEIIADIEARIAELLQAKVSQYKQVVLMMDVDDVINALGKPEEFGIEQEEPTAEKQNQQTYSTEPIKRRLFRDPDEKAIGGVCSGLAHYFDIDIVWIRLATFLLIFFGGVSLWVYIILWIVIPEARTTADRLAMRGERVNIDNISKQFKDEMDGVKHRMQDGFKSASHATNTAADRVAMILGTIFKIIGRIMGAFLIFIAIFIMIGLMSTIFGFSVAGSSADFNDWINLIFLDRSHYWLGFIGLIIAVGVPAFMLLYGGIKLLFKIKYSNRWLNIAAGLVWLIGFIMVTYAGVKTASDFSESSKYKEVRSISTSVPVFSISAVSAEQLVSQLHIEDIDAMDDGKHHFNKKDYEIGDLNGKKVVVGYPRLRIISATTDKIEVVINKKARGLEKRTAYDRAKEISYNYNLDSTNLKLDEIFHMSEEQKFRVQEIEIIVKVPKDKTIYLDASLKNLIYDVDNITNTYDQDMLRRRWKMTEKGLECVDCDGIENLSEKEVEVEKVIINEDGINVKDEHGNHVVIDENGININSENKDIHLKRKNKNE